METETKVSKTNQIKNSILFTNNIENFINEILFT